LDERTAIFTQDVDSFLSAREREKGLYDLLFIDPPYNAGLAEVTLEKVAASKVLAKGAIMVVEAGKREPISEESLKKGFKGLEQIDFRKYGDSVIYIFKKDG
jgi:16S rRNA (guanine966-N2)-methyltransferase